MEKKSRMIDEYMETICTDRKKNHVARRASRAYPNPVLRRKLREKYVHGSWRAVARGGKQTYGLIPPWAVSNNWF